MLLLYKITLFSSDTNTTNLLLFMKPEKQQTTQDILERKVSIDNVLIRSAQGLNLIEKRILWFGLAKMRGENETVKVTAREYAEAFEVDMKHAYTDLKKACENMTKRYLTLPEWHKRKLKSGKIVNIEMTLRTVWVSGYRYADSEGFVEFFFSQGIHPYLFKLKQQFTQYQLKQTAALKSLYSWRLLELLEQMRPTELSVGGGRWEKQEWGVLNISVDEFCFAMGIDEKSSYRTTFGLLRKRVIDPAINELSYKDGWEIKLEVVKTGRRITGLHFEYRRNPNGIQGDLFK